MTTSLIGRRARGSYRGKNPNYDEKAGEFWVDLPVEGEIVAVASSSDGLDLYIYIVDAECLIRKCSYSIVVVLPRDYVGELR